MFRASGYSEWDALGLPPRGVEQGNANSQLTSIAGRLEPAIDGKVEAVRDRFNREAAAKLQGIRRLAGNRARRMTGDGARDTDWARFAHGVRDRET